MKIAINTCFGGFRLSDKAYEKLIEWGVPVRAYLEQERDPETGLYLPQPANDGEVIFDQSLSSPPDEFPSLFGRYWDCWIEETRDHPLLIRVIEELGEKASSRVSDLKIVEIPDGVEWEIDEYDGLEHIAEKHRTWGR